MKITLLKVLVVIAIIVILCCLLPGLIAVPLLLVFGWIPFLARTLPRMTVEPVAIGVAIGSLISFAVLLHFLARGFTAQIRPSGTQKSSVWRWRWSLAMVGLVFLLVSSGLALTVSVHQIVWAFGSGEPLVTNGSRVGNRINSTNNLKETGLAFYHHAEEHGAYPPGGTFDEYGMAMHSWETLLLPYLENPVEPDLTKPWNDPENAAYFQKPLYVFLNPAFRQDRFQDGTGYALSHYAVNSRMLGGNRSIERDEVSDGLSNTILAGEVSEGFRAWGDPVNWRDPARGINTSSDSFGGADRAEGALFLMADGSVQFFVADTDPAVLEKLATPRGGEHVDASEY